MLSYFSQTPCLSLLSLCSLCAGCLLGSTPTAGWPFLCFLAQLPGAFSLRLLLSEGLPNLPVYLAIIPSPHVCLSWPLSSQVQLPFL